MDLFVNDVLYADVESFHWKMEFIGNHAIRLILIREDGRTDELVCYSFRTA